MSPGTCSPAVAGLTRLSTCDWPGMLVATVFLQGCPWACTYCHNPALMDPRAGGAMAWDDVAHFLAHRRGLLDGVVFSGGEPTLRQDLGDAIGHVRALGFGVGLHTAGAFPNRLAAVLDDVDWVGLDIKALPEDYPRVAGRPGSGERAWRSLEVLLGSGVAHEVRTTVHPGSPATERLVEIAGRLRAAGVRSFAVQRARALGARESFVADAAGWDERFADLVAQARSVGFESFAVRAA